MTSSHLGRAQWLATDAYDAMSAAKDATEAAIKSGSHLQPEKATELALRWQIVAAMQRQAELHLQVGVGIREDRDDSD
ncbi:hypothetical protein JK358_38160 [Nocardia sp. 2]|uniref:Uncharacterized protein n=1 Tax=Nocardia acididurans TaxID=2802282 RepID=A0ABS1MHU5_9NOCA|nr:hypothetical protein [Nocardia acididurans]MBL1080236.1 hypothetical protein [Nocardia acididurans]